MAVASSRSFLTYTRTGMGSSISTRTPFPIASASAAPSGYRSSGDFRRQRSNACATSPGTSGASEPTSGAGSVRCLARTAAAVGASKGNLPVSV